MATTVRRTPPPPPPRVRPTLSTSSPAASGYANISTSASPPRHSSPLRHGRSPPVSPRMSPNTSPSPNYSSPLATALLSEQHQQHVPHLSTSLPSKPHQEPSPSLSVRRATSPHLSSQSSPATLVTRSPNLHSKAKMMRSERRLSMPFAVVPNGASAPNLPVPSSQTSPQRDKHHPQASPLSSGTRSSAPNSRSSTEGGSVSGGVRFATVRILIIILPTSLFFFVQWTQNIDVANISTTHHTLHRVYIRMK
eukprot:TRINITY_DN6236_c0_g1_i1.p1 TRINITY_DN6236_c0_g1~~TRINITY_DN6236_c0_g1_i1.p1  ORF type:complete len:291 (-),score=35.09 TRINITY_DN6236_c0_g1_i1:6-758(-)